VFKKAGKRGRQAFMLHHKWQNDKEGPAGREKISPATGEDMPLNKKKNSDKGLSRKDKRNLWKGKGVRGSGYR